MLKWRSRRKDDNPSLDVDAILAYMKAPSADGAANVLSRIDAALSIAAEQPRIGQLTSRPG